MNRRLELAVVAAVALLDQLTKLLVVAEMELYQTIPIVPGLLNLTHIRNSGVAFGLFNTAEFAYKPLVMALVALAARWSAWACTPRSCPRRTDGRAAAWR